ncbi:MAG: hypothetical protein IJU38_10680 [Clostridia bacterium]|nr:hypothetical protein [Clostridia bacterium]
MIRKRLLLALVLGIALVLLCASAALADDPMKVSMELSTNKFSAPKSITVSITVTNVGDVDMPSPVTLYYPSGKKVEEFGSPTLAVGASKNWSGQWTVTQKELEAGKITFKIKYSVYSDEVDENGENTLVNKTKNFSKKIQYTGADPELEIERTIMPQTAQKGQEVSVTYEITNVGPVDVSGITIKENTTISTKSGTIDSIAAGETGKYTFTAVMGTKDLTSNATISYKAGGKTFTSKVDSATVKYGEVKLSATLTADKKGGAPGDTVKLTLKLKNSGTTDFTNVTATDAALGTVFSNEKVPAGETLALEKELTITETQDIQFTVKGEDGTGKEVETATGRISVIATDPTQQIVLNLEASADRDKVYKLPGTVRFSFVLHNDSAVEVKNVTVKAVETPLYSVESIPAGESVSFIRDTEVSMAGSYQFTASCKDVLGQTLNFDSNAIPIAYAEPTPVPTEAPLVTPPAPATEPLPTDQPEPEWLDQAEGVAGIAKWILAGVGGLLLLLLLIGAVRRGKSRSDSKKAMDHLEGATYRDYGTKPKHRRSEINNGGTEADHAAAAENENSAHSSELMAETLKRLYDEKAPEQTVKEAAEVVTEVADKAAEEAAAPAAETVEKAAEVSPETAEAVKEALQARAEETTGRRRRSKG